MGTSAVERIRVVLRDAGGIEQSDSLQEGDDLYAAGLTSRASVSVMLALEDEFDVEFPDELLSKGTFSSVSAIVGALEEIGAA